MTKVECENDFDFIWNYEPLSISISDPEKLEAHKKKGATNFLAGEMSKLVRNNDSMLTKNLITLDYDELENEEEFRSKVAEVLKPYDYILYPSISYGSPLKTHKIRYRLVINTNRMYSQEENEFLFENITNLIGFKVDGSSKVWSQIMGLPVITKFSSKDLIAYHEGEPLVVDEFLFEPERIESKKKRERTALRPRSTTTTMKNYIEREAENLKEYTNSFAAIAVLAKSVQEGEITQEYAEKYAIMLAMDNKKWEKENLKKLDVELKNPNLTTEYDFMTKFSKSNLTNRLLDMFECSQIMLKKYKFAIIGTEENAPLLMYKGDKDGIYTPNYLYIQKKVYAEEPRYTERQVNDVIFKIKMNAVVKEAENNRFLIPVNNGIFNLKSKKLEKFTCEKVFLSKVSTNYVENPPQPEWNFDGWLDEIANHDTQVVMLLWQLINECLNGNFTRGKYFILYGSGANGKGTFQQFLINLIGAENIINLKLEQIGVKFMSSYLVGKTANIGDDINSSYIEDNTIVQSITTGDRIMVEPKGKHPYPVTLKCALVFSANNIPKFKNKTNGTYRRLVLIPFNADFTDQKEDKSIKDVKINQKDVLEYVLHQALHLDFEKYINPDVVKQALEDYKIENDPILEFYETRWKDIVTSTRIPVATAYSEYRHFSLNAGYTPQSQIKFSKAMMQILGKGWEKNKVRLAGQYNEKFYPIPDPLIVHQCFVFDVT